MARPHARQRPGAELVHTSKQFIRRWFAEAGFAEVACDEWIEGTGMRVGVEQLAVDPEPLRPGEHIFTFYR